MTGTSLTLRDPTDAERDWIEGLLADVGLPTSDLRSGPATLFVAVEGGRPVGAGGLEVYGPQGLLRSVVVPEASRGRGYGTALCDTLEARARERGVETLYLLTTTAATFFAERGYEPVPRERVPSPIRDTSQFAELCPDSATAMAKAIR